MTAWQQLDGEMGKPYAGDAWSDHAFEQAIALAQKLTPTEFAALRSTWPHRSSDWRVRCADVLPWAHAPRQEIAAVLLEMVQFPDDELTIMAADTLREFDPAMVAAIVAPDMVDRLLEVARRNPSLSAGAIRRFLDALPLMRGKTEQIIQAVEQHPQRWQKVTRESALSLPVPVLPDGQATLAFFWYPVGGPIQNRMVWAPTYRVLASLSQSEGITFLPTDSAETGFGVASGQPLGKPTIGGSVLPAEMKQVRADLHRATDRMVEVYARAATSPNAYPDEAERAEMAAYLAAFRRLAVVVLLPAYRALSPHFFDWLDREAAPADVTG